jgi:hypothetical protein
MARRSFLASLLTGAGAAAGLGSLPEQAAAKKDQTPADTVQPILYRRTKEVERYYRTLYT